MPVNKFKFRTPDQICYSMIQCANYNGNLQRQREERDAKTTSAMDVV